MMRQTYRPTAAECRAQTEMRTMTERPVTRI